MARIRPSLWMQTDRKPVGICVDHFGRSTIRRQHAAGQKRPTAERTLSPAQRSTRGLPLTLAIRELQWGGSLRRRDVLAAGIVVPQDATFGVASSRHSDEEPK